MAQWDKRMNFDRFFDLFFVLVLASGFVLVTSKAARLFFLAFHLTAVIVVLKWVEFSVCLDTKLFFCQYFRGFRYRFIFNSIFSFEKQRISVDSTRKSRRWTFNFERLSSYSTVNYFLFLIVVRLTSNVFSHQIDNDEKKSKRKSFDFRSFCLSLIKPSVHRRMTVVLQSMNKDERAVLLRWIGHADMDSETLSLLNEETNWRKQTFFFFK